MSGEPRKGDLLIASSTLVDPNFVGTVILLCEHSEEGAYGLVLNRPLEVTDAIRSELEFLPDNGLLLGGPVQTSALQVMHPFGEQIPNAAEVVSGVWIGGDFDVLKRALSTGVLPADECRFFLGYAGWSGGQLSTEMDVDSWLTAPATYELVFETDPVHLWHAAIQSRGRREPLFAHFPEDPRFN